MYNLIVSGNAETWEKSHFDLDVDRFLEHTDPQIRERLRELTPTIISELTRLPTVFAYELAVGQPARVGRLRSIRQRQGTIRIEFAFDESIPPFSTEEFNRHAWDFDINKNEMYRHHWAVKDVDLMEGLRQTGLAPVRPNSQRFTFSRKTIVAAGTSLRILSHTALDHLLLEFGIEGLHAGRDVGSILARTNALVKFAIEHPSAVTAEGNTIADAIVERAVELNKFRDGQGDREALWSSLAYDGYGVRDGKIIPKNTLPSEQSAHEAAIKFSTSAPPAQLDSSAAADQKALNANDSMIPINPTVFRLPNIEMEPKLVSVMMPFDVAFGPVYAAIKESCVSAELDCKRVDDLWEDSVVIQDVFSLIWRSRIVVVDFTRRNPNVFYETGIAHTLGKPVVPIAQNEDDVPFDLRHHRFVRYLNNGEGLQNLIQKLASRLRTLTGAVASSL